VVTAHFTSVAGSPVVKDLKTEIAPGLLSDMCKQPGIHKEDL